MTNIDREATHKLLEMYGEYKKIDKEREAVASRLAKAKLLGEPTQSLSREYDELQLNLQQVSEKMTYSSPVVWMMYKYEAYADEPQPIRTMQDFRIHCSKPGYICTKRFNFVNAQLDRQKLPNLNDTAHYPDGLSLLQAINSPAICKLVENESFQSLWSSYEYYKEGERVAKWENY